MKKNFCIEASMEYPSMHAPSICELEGGDLLACCYAGTREGAPDSVVLGVRFDAERGEWKAPAVWVNVSGHAPANPRVFLGPDAAVWLVVGINYGHWCSGDTYLFVKRSYDAGRTWTDLEFLVETRGLLGKNKPFHEDSVWLIPVEWERTWSAAFLRSTDAGRTWEIAGDLGREAGARLIQPAVVRLTDGSLLAYMRSQEGHIYQSVSRDLGKTWTIPKPTALPNNNSGIDMARLRSGVLALVGNPTPVEPGLGPIEQGWPEEMPVDFRNWGRRTPLEILFSHDDGRTWPCAMTLEDGPGEYSYPAIIQAFDGTVHIVYSYRRRAILHAMISEDEIEKNF